MLCKIEISSEQQWQMYSHLSLYGFDNVWEFLCGTLQILLSAWLDMVARLYMYNCTNMVVMRTFRDI